MQHVYRTRFFIISTASDIADLPYVTKWLLENPEDFAVILEHYYRKNISEQFKQLLTEHLAIAGELINAIKNHETTKTDSIRKKWYQNADEISEFLSKINPYWNYEKWNYLLYNHLKMTENEARLRLSGKYPKDIDEFNNIENEALEMADYMSNGIVQQFRLC
ncbi:MAG: acetylglutamate kinase [Clostridia bacterium]|nr:acetylglutamate kinase [Clostridia bacterium]